MKAIGLEGYIGPCIAFTYTVPLRSVSKIVGLGARGKGNAVNMELIKQRSDKPAALHKQRELWDASCQAEGCEAYRPFHRAGSQIFLGSQRSLEGCNLQGTLYYTQTYKNK